MDISNTFANIKSKYDPLDPERKTPFKKKLTNYMNSRTRKLESTYGISDRLDGISSTIPNIETDNTPVPAK